MLTTKIDELNVIQNSKYVANIDTYFSEMELPNEDKKMLINDANAIFEFYVFYFPYLHVFHKTGNEIDENEVKGRILREYKDVLSNSEYDIGDGKLIEILNNLINSEVATLVNEIDKPYTTSLERAELLATNDINTLYNYERNKKMIEKGRTRKRWVTMLDNKVRDTHVAVDGTEKNIDEPFTVGGYEMMFPRDGSLCGFANANEIINCRCELIYY